MDASQAADVSTFVVHVKLDAPTTGSADGPNSWPRATFRGEGLPTSFCYARRSSNITPWSYPASTMSGHGWSMTFPQEHLVQKLAEGSHVFEPLDPLAAVMFVSQLELAMVEPLAAVERWFADCPPDAPRTTEKRNAAMLGRGAMMVPSSFTFTVSSDFVPKRIERSRPVGW